MFSLSPGLVKLSKTSKRKKKLNICQKESRQSQNIMDGSKRKKKRKSHTSIGKASIFFFLIASLFYKLQSLGFVNHVPLECHALINGDFSKAPIPGLRRSYIWKKKHVLNSVFFRGILMPFLNSHLQVLYAHQYVKYTTNSCVG